VAATVRDHLEAAADRLAGAGIASPRADAEWLLAGMLGIPRLQIYLALPRAVDDATGRGLAGAVARRARREPLQQILGWEAFRGHRIAVTPDVIVPRPETEILAGWALEVLPPPGARPVVVDVGTGSGCLACAVAAEHPDARVLAVDLVPAAVAVARRNVAALGLGRRVEVVEGDLLAPAPVRSADIIVSNPPYLPSGWLPDLDPEVRDHEPRIALDGGGDGLDVLRRLVRAAPRHLRPGGILLLETAGPDQVATVGSLLAAAGFVTISTRRDLAGVERFVGGHV
jgi:release factor glutamine methyltransferase